MAKDEAAQSKADVAFEEFLVRNNVWSTFRAILMATYAAGRLHGVEECMNAPDLNPTEDTADAAQN